MTLTDFYYFIQDASKFGGIDGVFLNGKLIFPKKTWGEIKLDLMTIHRIQNRDYRFDYQMLNDSDVYFGQVSQITSCFVEHMPELYKDSDFNSYKTIVKLFDVDYKPEQVKGQWISTKERLPEIGDDGSDVVIGCTSLTKSICEGYFNKDGKFCSMRFSNPVDADYWMPIPEMPQV